VGRNDRLLAVFIAVFFLVFYLATLCPRVYLGDSGELAAAGYLLDIAHPPGFPLYCLLARLFSLAGVGSVAARVNALSSVAAASAAGIFYLVARLGTSRLAALSGAFLVGSSSLLWSHAVVAEVYAPQLAFFLAALFFLLRGGSARDLALAGALGGLSAALHPLGIGVLPLLLLAPAAKVTAGGRARSIARSVLFFAIPLTLTLYLPIRSSLDPPADWGNPETLEGFLAHLLRLRYHDVPKPDASLPLFLRELAAIFRAAISESIPLPLLPLIPLGIVSAFARDRRRALLSFGALLLFGPLLVLALRFPLAPERVEENAVFFLPAFAILVLFLSFGVDLLLRGCAGRRSLLLGMRAVLLLLVAARCASAWRDHPYDEVSLPEEYARQVLASIPRGAILLAEGDDIVFPLHYLQRALGLRTDVQILDTRGTVFPPRSERTRGDRYATFPLEGFIPSGLLFRDPSAAPAPVSESARPAPGEERLLRRSAPLRSLWTNYLETRARSEDSVERAALFRRAALALSEESPETDDRRAVLYAEATVLVERGEEEEAAARLRDLLSEKPLDARASLLLATIELRRGDAESALRLASLSGEATASERTSSAVIHLYAGKIERARELLEEAARLDPLATEPLALLQRLASENAEWEKSARLGSRALAIDPTLAGVHLLLARAYRAMGDDTRAVRAYRMLLRSEPNHAGAEEANAYLAENVGVAQ